MGLSSSAGGIAGPSLATRKSSACSAMGGRAELRTRVSTSGRRFAEDFVRRATGAIALALLNTIFPHRAVPVPTQIPPRAQKMPRKLV